MKISVFGLGYVGAVISGCFAKAGHRVIGVDTDDTKTGLINRGRSPIVETGLDDLIAAGVKTGKLTASSDAVAAVRDTDISMVCVGTPSKPAGDLDLAFVARVCEDIGRALARKPSRHLVVIRSTMLPGSVKNTVIPALERGSGKQAGRGFGVAINPEFMRESTAVKDFYNPPKTVVGALLPRDATAVAGLYKGLPGPVIKTSIEVAELVKYVDNVFHALKITFANEIGAVCRAAGVDAHAVMDIFCQDRKLNLSPVYLKPGFAFGGSCLPKDLRALNRFALANDVEVPVLRAVGESNKQQIENTARLVLGKGGRRVGILGFAFKTGTDDLRESPVVTLAEILLGKGCQLKLYDGHVSLAKLIGANRRYIEKHIPHISRLMVDSIEKAVKNADIILIGNPHPEFYRALERLSPKQSVIDLTPHAGPVKTPARYERLCG